MCKKPHVSNINKVIVKQSQKCIVTFLFVSHLTSKEIIKEISQWIFIETCYILKESLNFILVICRVFTDTVVGNVICSVLFKCLLLSNIYCISTSLRFDQRLPEIYLRTHLPCSNNLKPFVLIKSKPCLQFISYR